MVEKINIYEWFFDFASTVFTLVITVGTFYILTRSYRTKIKEKEQKKNKEEIEEQFKNRDLIHQHRTDFLIKEIAFLNEKLKKDLMLEQREVKVVVEKLDEQVVIVRELLINYRDEAIEQERKTIGKIHEVELKIKTNKE